MRKPWQLFAIAHGRALRHVNSLPGSMPAETTRATTSVQRLLSELLRCVVRVLNVGSLTILRAQLGKPSLIADYLKE
jgi:hypothetical protein